MINDQTTTTAVNKVTEISKEGLEDLKSELKELLEVKLPAVIKRVAEAREYGDLSENSEYHDAKDEQNLVETRIADIEGVVNSAKVVKNTTSTTIIGMGSKVKIQSKGKNTTRTVQIVGEYEADPKEDKISNVSPLGKALTGKKKGEEAVVNAPAGISTFKIVEIK